MTTVRSIDLRVDVTDAAGLGEPAHVTLTVTAPDELGSEPVVCFGKPGGGYARGYYTADLPGPAAGAQADWHARAGVDLRLRRPPRCRRQLPARSRTALLHAGRGGESGRRSRRVAEAGGGHPHGRAPEGRASSDDRHRAVDGWLPHGRATGSLPLLRRHRGARLQRAAHASSDGTGHAAPLSCRGCPATPCRPTASSPTAPPWPSSTPTTGPDARRHGLGLPLRRHRPRHRAARPQGLPLPCVATCRRGDRPPSRRRSPCGASRLAGPFRKRRRSDAPSWWAWANAMCWWIPAGSRGPTSRPEAWTSSSAREWDTCTISRDAASCSGGASRRGRTGCGRHGDDGARPRRGPPCPAHPRASRS